MVCHVLPGLLSRRRTPPRLSVVVPVYNVEPYLADCLDSLVAQRFRDYEVVLVDDGSTDGSAAVAERYVRKHRNMELVRTDNRGLGAARNTGLLHTSCEYAVFLDSDDMVPADAYEAMAEMLDETGSDFVVGSVEQLVADARVEPPWIRRLHLERRAGITIDDWPPIMQNVFAWSKMYRRSFWDRLGLAFPEGLRYEDQVTTTEAYLRADAFDVLRRPVYQWRIRDDGTSITQRRHELGDLRDRLVTKALTTDVVTAYGSPDIEDFWARNGLPGDLPVYFREIPGCDEEYWRELHHGLRGLFTGRPPIEESRLRVPQRLIGWLVTRGRRADAEHVLRWLDDHPGPLSLQVRGAHVVAQLPLLDDPSAGIPEHVFRLGDHELEFDARLTGMHWVGPALHLAGMALIRGAPTKDVTSRLVVALHDGSGVEVAMQVAQRLSPEATVWVARGDQNYDQSGFEAHLDLTGLVTRTADQPSQSRHWTVRIDVEVGAIRRSGPFRSLLPGVELAHGTVSGRDVTVEYRPGIGLGLHVL